MDRCVNDALTPGRRAPQVRPANPFAARYGSQDSPPAATVPWNLVFETLPTHRSVRAYSDRRLPAGLLELLVAAAPSALSFSIVAVEGAPRKARLARLAAVPQAQFLSDGAFRVFGLTIGYPDRAAKTGIKPCLGQTIILHRECSAPGAAEALTAYDETLRGFRLDRSPGPGRRQGASAAQAH